jgi:hypothetical protein
MGGQFRTLSKSEKLKRIIFNHNYDLFKSLYYLIPKAANDKDLENKLIQYNWDSKDLDLQGIEKFIEKQTKNHMGKGKYQAMTLDISNLKYKDKKALEKLLKPEKARYGNVLFVNTHKLAKTKEKGVVYIQITTEVNTQTINEDSKNKFPSGVLIPFLNTKGENFGFLHYMLITLEKKDFKNLKDK